MTSQVRHGLRVADVDTIDPRLFWLRVDKERTPGCWEWWGEKGGASYPYGRLRLFGRIVGTHRIAWVMTRRRPVPLDLEVCHHCDNPRCVRPDHLYLGTTQQNQADRIRRRRGGHGSYINVEKVAA